MQRIWTVVLSVWAMLAIVAVLAWAHRPVAPPPSTAAAQTLVVKGCPGDFAYAAYCGGHRLFAAAISFDGSHGKGSHGRLHYGGRFTTVKDRKKEIGPGLLKAMLDQPGLTKDDLER